ncbi:nitroreductase family protein [Chryseobacterium sp. RG1]|uniref:Nitroreductase family protein n=1 Tax=Chryseobacterium tagetis TaxID=2801334 RepID=A0ABS8A2E5_9FLAO|nr:nitroreductase family protein [Chryseobacterium tagetis]MCA6068007.1 nitroreductase family protein [Chryseobacterium tagetis]
MNNRQELLMQRYGEKSIPNNIRWNEQIELLLKHQSVRNFLPDEIPEGTIETMVAAAQSASNSSNLNQWSVIVITDKELKSKLAEASRKNSKTGMGNPYIEQAPVMLLWVADMYRNSLISEDKDPVVLDYTDAVIMSTIDVALAAQNAAIAAESMDLGVVYLGVMRNSSQEVADLIGLPQRSYVAFGMLVGKPDLSKQGRIRPRLSQKAIVHYNKYDTNTWKKQVDVYEKEFLIFRESNNMRKTTWADSVRFSVGDMAFMDGREDLRKTLEKRNLKLL